MSRGRNDWVREQTVALAPAERKTVQDQKRAFSEQVDRYSLLEGDAADQFFILGLDEQAHHLKPVRALNGLFANTTQEQARELSNILDGSGNQLANLYATPQRAHQGNKNNPAPMAVHTLMRERGLEHGAPANKRHYLLNELDEAADMPFKYKKHLAKKFKEELVPLIKEAYDDAMTAYYEPTPQAQAEARERVIRYMSSKT